MRDDSPLARSDVLGAAMKTWFLCKHRLRVVGQHRLRVVGEHISLRKL